LIFFIVFEKNAPKSDIFGVLGVEYTDFLVFCKATFDIFSQNMKTQGKKVEK